MALNLLLPGFFQRMAKFTFFCFFFLCTLTTFGQIPTIGQNPQPVFGAVSRMGREVYRADQAKKAEQEQQERENNYAATVALGDTLFARHQYEEAIVQYNAALNIKQEQYVKDQIARSNAEIAREKRQAYQLLIDRADSLFAQQNYDLAIEVYTTAIKERNEQYPKDRIEEVKAEMERWKKVHFSGQLISDLRIDNFSSKAYGKDPYSDFLKAGKYPLTDQFLIYSGYNGLDGIAVPANTRLIVYSEANYKGKVLLDVTGPVLINNIGKKKDSDALENQTKAFADPLQRTFPPSTRQWSENEMNSWINGSMEIITITP